MLVKQFADKVNTAGDTPADRLAPQWKAACMKWPSTVSA
jgi:hypothetical protein